MPPRKSNNKARISSEDVDVKVPTPSTTLKPVPRTTNAIASSSNIQGKRTATTFSDPFVLSDTDNDIPALTTARSTRSTARGETTGILAGQVEDEGVQKSKGKGRGRGTAAAKKNNKRSAEGSPDDELIDVKPKSNTRGNIKKPHLLSHTRSTQEVFKNWKEGKGMLAGVSDKVAAAYLSAVQVGTAGKRIEIEIEHIAAMKAATAATLLASAADIRITQAMIELSGKSGPDFEGVKAGLEETRKRLEKALAADQSED